MPKTQKVAPPASENAIHFCFQGHKKLRLPRKMDMLKFIGGRRSKCIFLNLNIEKNAFRLHEEQNGTNDNFGDARDRGFAGIYIHTVRYWKHGNGTYISFIDDFPIKELASISRTWWRQTPGLTIAHKISSLLSKSNMIYTLQTRYSLATEVKTLACCFETILILGIWLRHP